MLTANTIDNANQTMMLTIEMLINMCDAITPITVIQVW